LINNFLERLSNSLSVLFGKAVWKCILEFFVELTEIDRSEQFPKDRNSIFIFFQNRG